MVNRKKDRATNQQQVISACRRNNLYNKAMEQPVLSSKSSNIATPQEEDEDGGRDYGDYVEEESPRQLMKNK